MMIDAYKNLYGLIGLELNYSFSKQYFKEKFEREKQLDSYYELFPIDDVKKSLKLFKKHPNLKGINVTIPYKESIIDWLDAIDPIAESIGAVNTVLKQNGQLIGYNTDVVGFYNSLATFVGDSVINQAYVLGSGGASKAICFVLDNMDIPFTIVSRQSIHGFIDYDKLKKVFNPNLNNILINTTPVGTKGFPVVLLPMPYEAFNEKTFLFDLVYNPEITTFMAKGIENGAKTVNGYQMLVGQAEASYQIWTKDYKFSFK